MDKKFPVLKDMKELKDYLNKELNYVHEHDLAYAVRHGYDYMNDSLSSDVMEKDGERPNSPVPQPIDCIFMPLVEGLAKAIRLIARKAKMSSLTTTCRVAMCYLICADANSTQAKTFFTAIFNTKTAYDIFTVRVQLELASHGTHSILKSIRMTVYEEFWFILNCFQMFCLRTDTGYDFNKSCALPKWKGIKSTQPIVVPFAWGENKLHSLLKNATGRIKRNVSGRKGVLDFRE